MAVLPSLGSSGSAKTHPRKTIRTSSGRLTWLDVHRGRPQRDGTRVGARHGVHLEPAEHAEHERRQLEQHVWQFDGEREVPEV